MEYRYEAEMEEAYAASLLKAFKRSVEDKRYPIIIGAHAAGRGGVLRGARRAGGGAWGIICGVDMSGGSRHVLSQPGWEL